MISRRRALTAAGAVTISLSSPVQSADGVVRLRLTSYLGPTSHSVSRIIGPWSQAIERESGGRIAFDRFWGGSLGRSPYIQFDLVRAGIPDIAFAQPNYTTGQFPQLQLLETPFLIRNSTEASLVAWELCQRGLVQGFQDVKLLGMWSAEPGMMFTRFPITGLDDLTNRKIRSAGRLEGEFLESLGATAESMFPTDVYEAMRRDTIQGSVQGMVATQTFQIYRAATHVLNLPFGVVLFALMMHKDVWQALPDDLKDVFERESGQRIALLGGGAYDQRVNEIENKFRQDGSVIFVEPRENDAALLEATIKPVLDRWMARTERGRETYETAQDILRQLRTRERKA